MKISERKVEEYVKRVLDGQCVAAEIMETKYLNDRSKAAYVMAVFEVLNRRQPGWASAFYHEVMRETGGYELEEVK